MRERKKRGGGNPDDRRSPEGVRIIPADEAQAAIDAGQAAGRRPEDELRFGDVPPAPEGPRPSHRFPLPDTVDPAQAVPRRPVISAKRALDDRKVTRRAPRIDPAAAHDARPWDARTPPPAAPEATDDPTSAAVIEGETSEAGAGWPVAPGEVATGYDPQAYPEPVADHDPAPAYEAAGYDPQAYAPPQQPETAPDPAGAGSYDPPSYEAWPAGPSDAYPATQYPAEPYPTGEYPPAPQPADPYLAAPQPGAYPPAAEPEPEPTGWEPSPAWRAWQDPATDEAPPEAGDAWAEAWEPTGQSPAVPAAPPTAPPAEEWEWPSDEQVAGATAAVPHDVPQATAPPDLDPYEVAARPEDDDEDAFTRQITVGDWLDEDEQVVEAGADQGAQAPEIEGASMAGAHEQGEGSAVDPPSLGLSMSGSTELPHWTDPPSGEVSAVGAEGTGDDLGAWKALGAKATRWRGDGDWDEEVDYDDLEDDEARVGAMDMSRSDHSDLYSFDAAFEALEEERSGTHRALQPEDLDIEDDPAPLREPVVVGSGRGPEAPPRQVSSRMQSGSGPGGGPGRPPTGPLAGGGQRNMGQAVTVGVALGAAVLIAAAVGSWLVMVVAAAAVVACAVEGYGMMQRAGFKPATLLGLVATAGVMFAAYSRGEAALPIVAVIMFVATMLWYILQIVEARPLANVAVTTMTWIWVGLLGSYAALLLRAHHGRGLFFGAVIPAVVADIVAFFVGRAVGHRPLAPSISPGKTVEGVIAGGVAALIAGAIIGKELAPWGGVKHGLLLGLVVAILAPIGDLFESMIKRDLSIKDSGSILPGHGGLLDRFDAVLLVLPASYYLASYLHLVRL